MFETVVILAAAFYLIRLGNVFLRSTREDPPQETARSRRAAKIYRLGRS